MSDTLLSYTLQSASRDMSEILDKWMDTLEADHSDWVCVDGEEGDHGAVHYRENGNIVCSKRSNGGDDDWIEMTEYGARRALEMIRENWEGILLSTIKSVEGIDLK